MRRGILTLMLLTVLGAAAVWGLGGFDGLARWAAGLQRDAQNAMANALRALHAGQPGALWALCGLAFTYGVAHAVGPGHGKVLIGAYGAGQRVALRRLSLIAMLASLAQATTAVLLVYAGVGIFALTRMQLEGLAADWLDPLSFAAIGALGLWLVWRGARRWWRLSADHGAEGTPYHDHSHHGHPADGRAEEPRAAHSHASHTRADAQPQPVASTAIPAAPLSDHAHGGEACPSCGHRHGPALGEVAALRGWRDAVLLIGAIAIRPCTGALFVLILTWRMGLEAAGIAATYAMGLGTALITVGVAALAVLGREGALLWAGRLTAVTRLMPVAEVLAGAVITAISAQLLLALA
ncbi:nickel/cobalt transporter [Roseicitreum antarcticum]|uniref:Nickel/cobalt efflux system n=1 Tax=Roseicitreum antarcticum TaxID=564137 RepID=A0A1H2XFP2_9RHOB|nr:hypothetical protein [Roseicitreum antarcticum]SDW91576.1 ABC-type nickel/cobalt efflux system, permease component RcnA [Roseicitreum antarcticum]